MMMAAMRIIMGGMRKMTTMTTLEKKLLMENMSKTAQIMK